jgi:L-galactonate 5-dehydrogenase
MKTLRITAPRAADVVERPNPTPGPGEVLVRVGYIGLCGSDLSTWRGLNPLVTYPRIPGHEMSGIVTAVGLGVTGTKVGEAVLAIPYTACNACSACKVGRFNCCRNNQTLGVQRDGALGALLVLPETKLLRVPGLDLEGLALVEPLSVGFHAAARGRIVAGETAVVIGCGAVGIGAVAGAAARGARVIAVDVDPRKLDLAKRLGAAETIDSRTTDLKTALAALDDGQGPPVLIEAVGNPAAFKTCVETAAFAGRVVYIGYAKEPVAYETKYFVQKELDIMGSRNATPADFTAAGAWLAQDPSRVKALISRIVPFSQAAEALAAWDADPGSITKILVDCSTT